MNVSESVKRTLGGRLVVEDLALVVPEEAVVAALAVPAAMTGHNSNERVNGLLNEGMLGENECLSYVEYLPLR